MKDENVKGALLVPLGVFALLVSIAGMIKPSMAQGNLTSDVTITRIKDIDIPSEFLIDVDKSGYGRFAIARPFVMAWSPFTNQIVVADQYVSIVNPVSGKSTRFDPGLKPSQTLTFFNWSTTSPILAMTTTFDTSVLDTAHLDKPVLSQIIMKAPHVLTTEGASVVRQGKNELLILAGKGQKKPDIKNPDVIAYDLKTGEKRFSWRFVEDGTEYYISKAKSAAVEGGDIYLAAYTHHTIQKGLLGNENKAISEHDIWVINFSKGQIHCRLHIYDKDGDRFNRDQSGNFGISFDGLDFSPNGKWIVASHWKFADVYEVKTCTRITRIFDRPNVVKRDLETPGVGKPIFSRDSRWLLSRWSTPANIGLWRTSDWKKVYDAPFIHGSSDTRIAGSPDAADFNADGSRFAIATDNKIVLYQIRNK